MTICHYCWNAGLHRFNFYKKDQRFCLSSVALYRPSISPRTTQSSPNVHSDHFLPFCCVPIGKPGHNIVHYLVKELSGGPGWFGFCSPVNGGNIGSIVHQDINSLGKGFQRCVKKILNCSSVCDVSFNHQCDAILLSNLELQFTQLFFGSDKKQKKGFLEFDQTYLATRTTSYLGTLQASCLAISAPKP